MAAIIPNAGATRGEQASPRMAATTRDSSTAIGLNPSCNGTYQRGGPLIRTSAKSPPAPTGHCRLAQMPPTPTSSWLCGEKLWERERKLHRAPGLAQGHAHSSKHFGEGELWDQDTF
ncbi:UNVERIFIED_CONTAM: hypothetical protein K2H54_056175 [Gekko kuhli]